MTATVKCLECGKILRSYHNHDFKSCECPNETFVDGGNIWYVRIGGMDLSKIEGIEPCKNCCKRGTYNKPKCLCECHILAQKLT